MNTNCKWLLCLAGYSSVLPLCVKMQIKYRPINAKLLFPASARQWLAINRKLGSFSALLARTLGLVLISRAIQYI